MIACVDQSTGRIVQMVSGGDVAALCSSMGWVAVPAPAGVQTDTHYVDAGEFAAFPARPSPVHAWDWSAKAWIDPRTLDEVKAAQKALIDAGRIERTFSPIEYAGSLFDADETAMRNVAGWQTQIAAGVTLPDGFVWRDHANVDHPADAAFVNGLGAAITLRGTYLYAQAWALKASIDAATTAAEAEAVTWP